MTFFLKNAAKEVYKEIIVKVHIPPRIRKSGRNNRAIVTGDTVTLSCQIVEGDPEPNIIWYKDGTKLENQDDGAIMFLDRKQTLR